MYLIVEGSDLVGKTEFIKQLTQSPSIITYKGNDYRGKLQELYANMKLQEVSSKLVVYDRCTIISEVVYGNPTGETTARFLEAIEKF